jgi:hypothetical protein
MTDYLRGSLRPAIDQMRKDFLPYVNDINNQQQEMANKLRTIETALEKMKIGGKGPPQNAPRS